MDTFAQTNGTDSGFIETSTVSADGTKIGYRKYGNDTAALILVQGAMGTMSNYDELAKSLANDFTVYVPERRGRGTSPKTYTPEHSIARDVEDIQRITEISGASYIFGLSSGAIITLEATKTLPSIKKTAIYEPPFYVKKEVPVQKINKVFDRISEGRSSAALARVFKIVKVGPAVFSYVPLPVLNLMTKAFIKMEDKQIAGDYAKIKDLIPAMRYDFTAVLERGGEAQSYSGIETPVLLLGGTESPKYLRQALDTLESTLPNAQRINFEKLDHNAAWNVERGGSPESVAKALTAFFKKG